ncbi:hypothetical protein AA313_de0200370 [Arthrobotrys entomopaga]|nr:hypothetical protein AA313_de0200370 [Arthrobotrys entomopaga]
MGSFFGSNLCFRIGEGFFFREGTDLAFEPEFQGGRWKVIKVGGWERYRDGWINRNVVNMNDGMFVAESFLSFFLGVRRKLRIIFRRTRHWHIFPAPWLTFREEKDSYSSQSSSKWGGQYV